MKFGVMKIIGLVLCLIIFFSVFSINSNSNKSRNSLSFNEVESSESVNVTDFIELWMDGYGDVNKIKYSPNGKELAISSDSGGIYIFNSSDYSLDRKYIFHNKSIYTFDWSPDNKQIALGSDKEIIIIDSIALRRINSFKSSREIRSLEWSPNGSRIAIAGYGYDYIHHAQSGEIISEIDVSFKFAWSPDSKMIAYIDDGNVIIMNTSTGHNIKEIDSKMPEDSTYRNNIGDIRWSPDGSKIAYQCKWVTENNSKAYLNLVDYSSGEILGSTSKDMRVEGSYLSWSPDSSRIAVGTENGRLYILSSSDISNYELMDWIHTQVKSIDWSPINKHLAIITQPNWIQIFDIDSEKLIKEIQEPISHIYQTILSPNNNRIASCYSINNYSIEIGFGRSQRNSGKIRILNRYTGKLFKEYYDPDRIFSLSYSPDGKKIAYCSLNSTKIIYSNNGTKINEFKLPGDKFSNIKVIKEIAWSPKQAKVACSSTDRKTRIWDTNNGRLLLTLNNTQENVSSLVWSPDGIYIAICSDEGPMQIWDTRFGYLIHEFSLPSLEDYHVTGAAWAPDGKEIAGSGHLLLGIWDINSGELLKSYSKYSLDLNCYWGMPSLSWSSDGSKIAQGNCQIIIWDLLTERAIILSSKSIWGDDFTSFIWSKDNKNFVSSHHDDTIRLWGSPADIKISDSEIIFSNDKPEKGKEVEIQFTVKNDGKINASNVDILIYDGNVLIDQHKIELLEKGKKKNLTSKFTTSKNNHTIRIELDPNDNIPEFNSSNNQANKTIFTTESPKIDDINESNTWRVIVILIIIIIIILAFKISKKKK